MRDTGERRRLMKLRREIDGRRPRFRRPESWRYVRVHPMWRRPRGLDNRVRRRKKGWPPSPNPGYRSPRAVRGLHPSGIGDVLVYNVGDLAIIDPETQLARIGGSVGGRKRVAIVDEALQRGIRVLNPGKGRAVMELEEAAVRELEEAAEEAAEEAGVEEEMEEQGGEKAPEEAEEMEAEET